MIYLHFLFEGMNYLHNSICKRFLWAITMGQLRDSYGEEKLDFHSLSIYPPKTSHREASVVSLRPTIFESQA